MSAIKDNLHNVLASLSQGVSLCAVSKYHPESELQEAYDAGQRIFGESHVQELVRKQAALPEDIQWHFIGHLQTNKVKYIAPFVSLIHSADSPRLIAEINKQGVKCGRRIPILLQLHLAQEETKYGFTIEECRNWLAQGDWKQMEGIDIRGIMTMASYCDDPEQWRKEFRTAKTFFEEITSHLSTLPSSQLPHADPPSGGLGGLLNSQLFQVLSMGMSHDYKVAMSEGATLVRIGTAIFGERDYSPASIG